MVDVVAVVVVVVAVVDVDVVVVVVVDVEEVIVISNSSGMGLTWQISGAPCLTTCAIVFPHVPFDSSVANCARSDIRAGNNPATDTI